MPSWSGLRRCTFRNPAQIFGDGVDSNIDGVGVCGAERDAHLAKSVETCPSDCEPTHALKSGVKSDGYVKTFGKAGGGVYLLLP